MDIGFPEIRRRRIARTHVIDRAQLRFLKPELHDGYKCRFIGDNSDTHTSHWFGADNQTLERIATLRRVLLVEGPSDVLACRIALGSGFPVLAMMCNSIGKPKLADLLLLGVQKVFLMMDNEGVGQKAAKKMKETLPFRVQRLTCPGKDPSDCLRESNGYQKLQKLLKMAVG
jgi:hypothetical protein